MFVPYKSEHMDHKTVTGAMGGGAHSYVKMLTPNDLTDLKKWGGGGI